ncbi:hypothetical protein D3C71_2230250 [compost metagenome]
MVLDRTCWNAFLAGGQLETPIGSRGVALASTLDRHTMPFTVHDGVLSINN